MRKSAIFSDDRVYRYTLTRVWDESLPMVAFIGLNPSTADEQFDDPTIRRCIGFAESWGFGGLVMLNIFAYRSTDPKPLYTMEDPVGPENNRILLEEAGKVDFVVAVWGVHGLIRGRGLQVKNMIPNLQVLGTTKGGFPKHPLYLRADLTPNPWREVE